jgi:Putative beta-lactamase-inhibitor-like, PepSY-like
MKTLVLSILCLFAVQLVAAQNLTEAQVPTDVTAAFAAKFPGAKPEWEKKGEEYHAEFKLQKEDFSACFTSMGGWLRTENQVPESALPVVILEALKKDYPTYKLAQANRIDNANATITYKTYLEHNDMGMEVLYTTEGVVLMKSEMKKRFMDKE